MNISKYQYVYKVRDYLLVNILCESYIGNTCGVIT